MQEELAGIEEGAPDNEQLRNLRPTLEPSASKETEAVFKVDQKENNSRFSTTFGFSHGVENNNGGILLRKNPNYKGLVIK